MGKAKVAENLSRKPMGKAKVAENLSRKPMGKAKVAENLSRKPMGKAKVAENLSRKPRRKEKKVAENHSPKKKRLTFPWRPKEFVALGGIDCGIPLSGNSRGKGELDLGTLLGTLRQGGIDRFSKRKSNKKKSEKENNLSGPP